MNQTVAGLLKYYIEDLCFVDKIAGLVQTVYQTVTDENGVKVQKSYPVSCNFTAEDCKNGLYNDLAPDSKYKTVIYFEDGGVSFNERKGNFACYTSTLKLVCWINVAKFEADWCGSGVPCTVGAEIIKRILCAFPPQPVNITPFTRFYPVIVSEEIRSNAIFSKYTYSEIQTQYLLYPFDFFALQIKTDFCICTDDCNDECGESFKRTECIEGLTNDSGDIIIS